MRSVPPEVQGHGKFVASIIAQEEPSVGVVIAGMSNLTDESFEGDLRTLMPAAANGITSDELQLYATIERFGESRTNFDALNLSLGTYQCPDLNDSGFAMRAAIGLWTRKFRNAPIVAAAGNHEVGKTPPTDFIPAAWANGRRLYGIVSVDSSDNLSPFSNDARDASNGGDTIGMRHDCQPRSCESEWTTWSGTSFAAPVASARLAVARDAFDRSSRLTNGRRVLDR